VKNRVFGPDSTARVLEDPTFPARSQPPPHQPPIQQKKKKHRDGTDTMLSSGARRREHGGEGGRSHLRRPDGGGGRGRGNWGVREEAGEAVRHPLLPREHRAPRTCQPRPPAERGSWTAPREVVAKRERATVGERARTAGGQRERKGGGERDLQTWLVTHAARVEQQS
jgi:hypothetical protein